MKAKRGLIMKYVDLVGRQFGELKVLAKLPREEWRRDRHTLYDCVCSCGNHTIRTSNNLKRSKSCGCLNGGKYGIAIRTRNYRLYRIWLSMRSRCNAQTNGSYKNYGLRGIRVCDEWNSFEAFAKWAYANGYSDEATRKECTLDRIDPDGNYQPDNCRWTNSNVQALNKRRVNNKSGARGVWVTRTGKYHAVISVDNKRLSLGTYEKIEDAIEARHKAEMKYFGVVVDA